MIKNKKVILNFKIQQNFREKEIKNWFLILNTLKKKENNKYRIFIKISITPKQ